MKIAIQGHLTRGKEVIQILESLGGKKLYHSNADDKCLAFFIDDKGYISCLHYENPILKEYYKIYTLKEFEKEFPFKPGDTVIDKDGNEGCIDHLCDVKGHIYYSVKYNYNQFGVCFSKALKLKKKETNPRNITLTIDKAREWYNKGGELREIALQAFAKEELNPLPKSWEEYCKMYPSQASQSIFIMGHPKKYIALWKLEQLRDCYRQGWKPDSGYFMKFCIIKELNTYKIVQRRDISKFLSFRTHDITNEFLKNFEPLIKEAEDLI